jgi:hypothetical protein
LLGVKLSTQNDMIYGELGRYPLKLNRFCRIIKYWLKVVKCKETKYIFKVYQSMLDYHEQNPGKSNWASLVKKLLSELGFYEVWLNQGVGNNDIFLSLFKQR